MHKYANLTAPTMIIEGRSDPATPYYWGSNYANVNKASLISFPFPIGHYSSINTPCGDLTNKFLKTQVVDKTCFSKLLPVSFEGTPGSWNWDIQNSDTIPEQKALERTALHLQIAIPILAILAICLAILVVVLSLTICAMAVMAKRNNSSYLDNL